MKKRVLFITGTRADFGKMKPLINILNNDDKFEIKIFVTGMHMLQKYGLTWEEINWTYSRLIFPFINQNETDQMDSILAKTITGLSDLVREFYPDLIIVHGDRIEALAGAIVGAFNDIRVAHIEGGEISGTLDEIVRHSISKLSHFHFVSNIISRNRLLQMGEHASRIHVIGSPEVDIIKSDSLPTIEEVRSKYAISFDKYNILIFHPVTFEYSFLRKHVFEIVKFISKSKENFVVIYPNNDKGSEIIFDEYSKLNKFENVRLIPSMRFEYYLTALKNARAILGNSSSGVREAPVFGIPSVNIGSRQTNRSNSKSILNCNANSEDIEKALSLALKIKNEPIYEFGEGNTASNFIEILRLDDFWKFPVYKQFVDLNGLKKD